MAAFDAIIVGGGAAGCYAAIAAAARGRRVAICEHNPHGELGKKLRITGKGRCNVTNACDLDGLMRNIPRGGRFLYSAFSACMPTDVMAFFEAAGVPLKIERGNRVFPVSDSAADIVAALGRACKQGGVTILPCQVTGLLLEDGVCKGVQAGDTAYAAEAVLVATGGSSYPLTGSDGSGYALARQAGHTVTPLVPSLVPFVTEEQDAAEMMGLSLKNVTLGLYDGKKKLYQEQGEMLFTHFGVSGPLVLSASCHIARMERGRYRLLIDMKPALTPEQLDQRVLRDFGEVPNRALSNVLSKLLPKAMIPVVLRRIGLDGSLPVHQVTKAQRQALCGIVKALPYTIRDFRPIKEAIITSGGVSLKEIDPKTMASRLVAGLYFAGEILDADAYTGGFNLQIAFATGYAAGQHI